MKIHNRLEQITYCAFLVLLTSLLIGLVIAVWMAIIAGVIR